jgi:hypothetical protein
MVTFSHAGGVAQRVLPCPARLLGRSAALRLRVRTLTHSAVATTHPVMRLQAKSHDPGQTARRSYHLPQPALDRLCATKAIDCLRRQDLLSTRQEINPLRLRNEVHALIDRLARLLKARPGKPQDVYRTLYQAPRSMTETMPPGTLSIEGSISAQKHFHLA